ncbi:MAG: cytidylate kinase-like family protein [Lachnospiraceae bacterium]|nr:cytidylate kinase-like family protein [Lachnospiraceae bacterium]
MRIITISRQFGSGGRELGERLANQLGWDYYDKEIIETLAEKHDLDEEFIRDVLSRHGWHHIRLTYSHSFSQLMVNPSFHTQVLLLQSQIIREIAEAGNDCVIVGRDADVILHDKMPFRLLVCADREARLKRCMAYEDKKAPEERLSEKTVLKNITRIDKNRMRTREILTGKSRSDHSAFDLIVNSSGRNPEKLATALADFSLHWFEDMTNED